MSDFEKEQVEPIEDDEVQITDLDAPHSPMHKRAARISGVIGKSLRTRWIRYGLSGGLILLLLSTLVMQLPRAASPSTAQTPNAPAPILLDATTDQGLIFMQNTNYTLLAYQVVSGHLVWHTRLPAAATLQAEDQTLYCYFRLTDNTTTLEALDMRSGRFLWRDPLPATLLNATEFPEKPTPYFAYSNHTLYIQGINDMVYAIQASSGQIAWRYQADNPPVETPQAGENFSPAWLPQVVNGIVIFLSARSVFYILDASTGREILRRPVIANMVFPSVDGQVLYIVPPPGIPTIQAFHLPDGRPLWTRSLPHNAWVQMEMEGIVYVGEAPGSGLVALRGSDGQPIWSYQASDGQPFINSLFVAHGAGYLLQQDATLVSIRVSDGSVLWRSKLTAFKNQISQNTTFTIDDGYLLLYDSEPDNTNPIYVLRASDGKPLWHTSEPASNPFASNGVFYIMHNNGQFDAWRESDGAHLWSYNSPVGTTQHFYTTGRFSANASSTLFLLSPTGTLYVLSASDGILRWHYP